MEEYEHICGGCGSFENVEYLIQAQLEAVRRELENTEKAYQDKARLWIDAERLKADTYMKSSAEWFIANKYTQQQLDAERIRREQVEMANYAKDGQIETLQAQLAQIKGLVRALPYQTGNITKLNVEVLTILDAQPFVDLLTYRATLGNRSTGSVPKGGDGE